MLHLVPIAGIAMIVAVVWIISSARVKSAQIQSETVGRLVDKLGSGQEAMAYLESESGQKLLEVLTKGPGSPHTRILGAAIAGVVLSTLGLGLLIAGDTHVGNHALGGGIVILALGIGFLLAAGLSYKLSKSWGLVSGKDAAPNG